MSMCVCNGCGTYVAPTSPGQCIRVYVSVQCVSTHTCARTHTHTDTHTHTHTHTLIGVIVRCTVCTYVCKYGCMHVSADKADI